LSLYIQASWPPAEFLRDIPLDNGLLLLSKYPVGLIFHQVVFLEVLDIFWMDQVLFPCVLVMEFLEVVDLIFVLVVAVMTRSQSKIRELLALTDLLRPLISSDDTALIGVEDLEDLEDRFVFLVCGCIFQRFVVQAVYPADLVGRPGPVVVEVV
jgi:hypothetical protein